jgi:hypothetical protein
MTGLVIADPLRGLCAAPLKPKVRQMSKTRDGLSGDLVDRAIGATP